MDFLANPLAAPTNVYLDNPEPTPMEIAEMYWSDPAAFASWRASRAAYLEPGEPLFPSGLSTTLEPGRLDHIYQTMCDRIARGQAERDTLYATLSPEERDRVLNRPL